MSNRRNLEPLWADLDPKQTPDREQSQTGSQSNTAPKMWGRALVPKEARTKPRLSSPYTGLAPARVGARVSPSDNSIEGTLFRVGLKRGQRDNHRLAGGVLKKGPSIRVRTHIRQPIGSTELSFRFLRVNACPRPQYTEMLGPAANGESPRANPGSCRLRPSRTAHPIASDSELTLKSQSQLLGLSVPELNQWARPPTPGCPNVSSPAASILG